MKKKLILVLSIVALLVSVFAISVSASTIYKESEGKQLFSYEVDSNNVITSYEGEFPKVDADGNALTWYVTATATDEDGNTVKTVASVLTTDSTHFSITDGKYSYIGTVVTQYNVVSVNFPDDAGITSLNLANEGYRTKDIYAYSPNATEILFVYLPNTLTTLPTRIGQGSKMLICDMPNEMPITYISNVAFHDSRCLRKINIPSAVTEIAGQSVQNGAAFYKTVSLETVTFGSNDNLETIGSYAFHYSGVKHITLPDSLETIGEHAFSYSSIIDSPFTENSRLTTIGGRAFGDNPNLKTFIVPVTLTSVAIYGNNDYGPLAECTGIELVTYGNAIPMSEVELPSGSFFGRATIGKVVLPEGLTHIPAWHFAYSNIKDVKFSSTVETAGERVFQGATVEVIRLGAGFKYFTNSQESNHQSFTNVTKDIKEFYIPASFYAEAPETKYQVSYAFSCGSQSNIKFFYTGTLDQLTVSMNNFKSSTTAATENNQKFTSATQISYIDYKANPEAYSTGNYIIYGYNACDAFFDSAHNISTAITYPSFDLNGTKTTCCTNLGCDNKTTVSTDPLFTCLGYSAPEDDRGGIVIGFTVDNEAIAEYEAVTGKALKYGVFAVAQSKLGSNEIFDDNGTPATGVIHAEISNYSFVAFELKIIGFVTDVQKEAKLAMGAYVAVTDGETTEYSYMQEGTLAENEKYCFVSYNEVVNSKSTTDDGAAQ